VVAGETMLEQAGIQAALAALRGSYALVGQMPPEPPTWRGRVGAKVVRLVKRLLFWYTPQIVRFQYSALRAFEEQAKALEIANQRLRELYRRQDDARESVDSYIRQLQDQLADERARHDALQTGLQGLCASMPGMASQMEACGRRVEPVEDDRRPPESGPPDQSAR